MARPGGNPEMFKTRNIERMKAFIEKKIGELNGKLEEAYKERRVEFIEKKIGELNGKLEEYGKEERYCLMHDHRPERYMLFKYR